ncbi:CRISPR-associated protein Cas2 [Thermoactinomyces sp. DSM 45891]|uniref:CRISPR-associated endonuclease Cas2 n=1 Tax=Thermoactinomyces sp. DSM 45891 TaxID=1761907 RepID=UPI000922C063|nr:CRISPR-associated protein Cas2 [Thermoactinomyces sp. DSM 45891]
MYVLGVYDINVKRVSKVKKIFSRYLFRVQNSTFEGDLTKAQLKSLQLHLKKIIVPNEDQVIFFTVRSEELVEKICMGERESSPPSPTNII